MNKEPSFQRNGRALNAMRYKRKTSSGMALVIVLASLIFLVGLAVAFLASSEMQLKSSKSYAEGGRAQLLAQSAVNLAMTQISAGTMGVDAGGNALAWASQPGMIRTYDTGGAPAGCYKLYSWDVMTSAAGFDPSASAEKVPGDWHQQKGIFTDLNQPITGGTGSLYPIIDGNNLASLAGNNTYVSGTGTPAIAGFFVSGTDTPVAPDSSANPVPMPVKWLYVLADGKITTPSGGSKGTATFTGDNAPTAGNPIVGRVAFWTDDETCKVNINTAAEGTYWDTPKVSSTTDRGFATFQPAQHEYQRYPGHPAMTALSTVFSGLTPEQIYAIVPRVTGGPASSLEGTRSGTAALTSDSERLYASIDELMFKPNRDQNDSAILDNTALEHAKFFLTASSRAPDLNLFGKPRVCIWPISSTNDPAHRTAFDQLIAFCSTVNSRPYYFLRSDATSQSADLPNAAAGTGLGRNRGLWDYLQTLTSQNIPGFGGKFSTKYNASTGSGGTDRDQILTEIFDYIRSVNIADSTVAKPFATIVGASPKTGGNGQVVPIAGPNGTRGFGRFPTVQGAFLIFIGSAISDSKEKAARPGQIKVTSMLLVNLFNPSMGYVQLKPRLGLKITGAEEFQWSGVDPSGAASALAPMGFASSGLVVPSKLDNPWGVHGFGGTIDFHQFTLYQAWGTPPTTIDALGHYAFISGITYMKDPATTPSTFDFTGGDIKIEIKAPNGATNGMTTVQTVTLNFPSVLGKIPVPFLAPTVDSHDFQKLSGVKGRLDAEGPKRSSFITTKDVVRSIVPAAGVDGDLRLVMPRATVSPADDFFAPHSKYFGTERWAHNLRDEANDPYYGSTAGRLLKLPYYQFENYSPTHTQNNEVLGTTNSAPRDSSVVPDSRITSILGDWDNGVGWQPDGPYINKADEGDGTATTTLSDSAPYYSSWAASSVGSTLFSPNRMMPSAGMFGSLPTGVWAKTPWQTLLFCPNPLAGPTHKGFTSPPDYLFLDLFNMPVVEPYAISEPLSTAGRINMNYQIVPFTYINRDTGIRAILKSEKVVAIRNSNVGNYKRNYFSQNVRLDVNADETLKGFLNRFDAKDIFRSPSEICSLSIVPQETGITYATMSTYWNDKQLTGDNSRERPYVTIYPRLTTQSNSFTVHFRAQALKKVTGTAPAIWDENKDLVTGEFRGSETLERYIDPNNTAIPDYVDPSVTTPISSFYKFRVVQAKQFAP